MTYNGTIYRPPIEADTFLLPVTEGCTHNSCTFCNMYQDIPFRMLSLSEEEEYLRAVNRRYGWYCEKVQRVYLVGADPFALSAERLLERIRLIRRYLPNAKVITMYARTDNIASKSDEDLKALKEAGVDDLYIGVECGLNDVLEKLNKGYSAEETRRQCLRLNAAGMEEAFSAICQLRNRYGKSSGISPGKTGLRQNSLSSSVLICFRESLTPV